MIALAWLSQTGFADEYQVVAGWVGTVFVIAGCLATVYTLANHFGVVAKVYAHATIEHV